MEYRVLRASQEDLLEKQVSEYLNRGWSTSGGVAVCFVPGDGRTADSFVWAQAVNRTKASRFAVSWGGRHDDHSDE